MKRPPKVGQVVLAWFNVCGMDVMCYKGKGLFVSCLGWLTEDVTDWMPLPKSVEKMMKKVKYVR